MKIFPCFRGNCKTVFTVKMRFNIYNYIYSQQNYVAILRSKTGKWRISHISNVKKVRSIEQPAGE